MNEQIIAIQRIIAELRAKDNYLMIKELEQILIDLVRKSQ